MRTLSLSKLLSPALAVALLAGSSSPASARHPKAKGGLQQAAATETPPANTGGQAPPAKEATPAAAPVVEGQAGPTPVPLAPAAAPAAPIAAPVHVEQPLPPAEGATAAPVTPAAATQSPAPRSEAAAAAGSLGEAPQPAAVAPPVTEVGIQRLPGSAYPEPVTRGLKYGSLWLTFHGLQWPYLPAGPKGERFVIGLSGWGWVDTAYEKFGPWGANPTIKQSQIKYWKGQSRLLARVTPTYSFGDDLFIQGQVELVGSGDQTISRSDVGGADTDDLYLRFGKWNSWDITAGRFEGWEVFHLGMGLDQNTFERQGAVGPGEAGLPISFYGLTDNQFRPSAATNAAFHYYPLSFLRFEVLGMGLDQNTFERQGAVGPGEAGLPISFYGLTDNQFRPSAATNAAFHYYPLSFLRFEVLGMAGTINNQPTYATRPVAILDFGWLKLKGGVEYTHGAGIQTQSRASTIKKGVGGAIQFVFDPHIEAGFNIAQGTVESYDDSGRQNLKASLTRTSLGGFANVSNGSARHPILLGLGALWTRNVDQNDPVQSTAVVDNYWMLQSFVALQYVAYQQLYIKLVGGYSRGHWLGSGPPPITYDDEMYSVRMRFAFYF